MIYINKMDIMGADFYHVLDMVKDRLKANAVPIQLPIGKEETFKGIIDLLEMQAYVYYDDLGKDIRVEPIPDDMKELAQEYHDKLVEEVAETDEELMMKYLDGEELTIPRDEKGHPQGHHRQHDGARHLRYVLQEQGRAEAAGRHRGLHARPDRRRGHQGREPRKPARRRAVRLPTTRLWPRWRSRSRPTRSWAKLCFFRVYSGVAKAGTTVYNSVKDSNERLGRILQMHANHRKDIDECYAGDIAAAVGLKNTTTGDTLCDEKAPHHP